jgi:hypothetical protein
VELQTLDPPVFVDGKKADVHRFDDRLIEFFQQREFFGVLLLRLIQRLFSIATAM